MSKILATFVVAVLLGTAQANVSLAIEDPQTAERLWSTPNLKKIQENYKGPELSKDEAGETKILITFILYPDGHVEKVKSVKRTGSSIAKNGVSRKHYGAIKAALVQAIKASEPLYYRKRPDEKEMPWGVVYVYYPKKYPMGRMIHVARGKDRL